MSNIKLSVVIPYKQRLDNIALVFEALAAQTMDSSEFEVVVGAMEYCEEYLGVCAKFADRLTIISVVSSADFDIPRARNLGMRQASGRVIVQMDADTLLPPSALQNLWDRHFSFGQNVCIVGQVVGYGNNNDGSVESVEVHPLSHYESALAELAASVATPRDPRFQVPHIIPWALAWTGLIALPAATVRAHNLFFDEGFRGWGIDDLEWSYRICASGVPIVLRPDVHAIHLPHVRNAEANRVTERANYRRFLHKWPEPDVELAHAIGDLEANTAFLVYQSHVQAVAGGRGWLLGTLVGKRRGRDALVVGAPLDAKRRLVEPTDAGFFDDPDAARILPLAGLALPFDDKSISECRILPAIAGFAPQYRTAVHSEAERVAVRVTVAEQPGA